ncbi:MAG TPA: beta-Ala-His dipeptidase [Thermoleophilia bacterium]|nr:beta-Ala-His dipeptidase [Thermoleophilia bacterium]
MSDADYGRLEPAVLWARFRELAAVPRPPRGEGPALTLLREWAAGLGLAAVGAGGDNLLVRVPASAGREGAPIVLLQAHVDMVCERDPSSPYDPATGGIGLVVDGDWLRADGTTLGADNGIGVAVMQAVAESDTRHGPLELLFTTAEEIGLEGAGRLDAAAVRGRLLLNLDSEDDGVLTVGCAGATDSRISAGAERTPALRSEAALRVTVSGAAGGHSGMDIASGRANAIKVLAGCLQEMAGHVPCRLASMDGGTSRNAIPREAEAVVLVPEASAAAAWGVVEAAGRQAQAAFAATDPGVRVAVADAPAPPAACTAGRTATLIDLLVALPNGPLVMSSRFPGVVETSTSLGAVETSPDVLEVHSLTRTSNQAALRDVLGALAAVARLAGADLDVQHGYPAWEPRPSSHLLETCVAVWRDLFGDVPVVAAAHAGLEPAVIGQSIPDLDMVSVGPRIESPHSPAERVSISSVQRFWRFLLATLDALSA